MLYWWNDIYIQKCECITTYIEGISCKFNYSQISRRMSILEGYWQWWGTHLGNKPNLPSMYIDKTSSNYCALFCMYFNFLFRLCYWNIIANRNIYILFYTIEYKLNWLIKIVDASKIKNTRTSIKVKHTTVVEIKFQIETVV